MRFHRAQSQILSRIPAANPIFLLAALALAGAPLGAATVTALKAESRKGQTFLTFQEAQGATRYSVYRSDKPIAALEGLVPVATLDPGSGIFKHTGQGHIITDLGQPLPAGTGLYVHTTRAAGAFHYAVVHPGDAALVPGANVTAAAVNETVAATPGAVRIGPAVQNAERMLVTPWFAWEDYAAWDHSKGYYGHRFNQAVAPNASGNPVPLTLVLHSAGSNGYREPDSYFDRGVGVAIFPRDDAFNDGTRDPYTGQTRFHSGWYGYATGGIAVNHTERRLIRYLRLALEDADLKIDPARVYVRGTSMGGGGALHLAYHYPHLFAAAAPTIGWVDPDAWSRGIWAKEFGEPAARMPVNAQGGPSWWDWQNMAWMVDNWPGRLPPVLHTFRKDDDIIDERAYPALLEKTEKAVQGQISQWQDGGHRGFSLKENAEFLRFRRDEAYPVFAAAASSDPFSAQEGQRNLGLDWSSRHRDLFSGEADAIADSLSGLAMTFKSMAADVQVDVTPRNAQRFHPLPGDTVRWTNRAQSGGALLDSGTAVADARGLVTARIRVTAAGNRLALACAACGAPSRRALLRSFVLPEINPLPVGAIDHARRTVTLTVPGNADLGSLRPLAEHTGSSLQPASGAAVDFSSPVEYRVTGSGAEAVYTVEIKRGPVSIRRKRDIPELRDPDGRKAKPAPGGAMRPRSHGNPMLLGPDASGDWYSANGRMQGGLQEVFPPRSTFP